MLRAKKLSKATDRQKDSLESLHNTAAKVLPKISSNDQSLVEEKIRSVGNKHTHLQVRIERARQQYEGVSANLSDIKAEVDKYLLWLTKQEQMMSEKVIAGKHLQSAEIRLENSKSLCKELQSKEATIETVKGKVEELIRDLPHSERAFVDDWITQVCDQHQKVYSLAADQQKLLASSVEQRQKVQHKLQQVCQWLQKKEREICEFQLLRLSSQEVEKQLERCRALQNDVTGYKQQIDELQKRGKMLHIDCTAEEMTEINSKLSEVDNRYAVLLNDISTYHSYLRDSVVSRRNFESDLLKNDKWCRETEMRCASEPVLDSAVELLEEQLVHYKSLQKTSRMFESLGKVIEETGISFKPKLVEEDKLNMAQQLKNAREQYDRCANLIQERLQCIEAVVSARSETEEKIREASNWIENIETELKKLSKQSGIDVTDGERVLEKFEAIGESLSIYQPTVTQLNQESERLHNSGQSIDARRIMDITTKYEILQDQVTHQRKKIHKELVLQQQCQSQSEHVESLLSECKGNLEKVDHQETGEKMKTLKMITDKFMEADTLFIQLDDKMVSKEALQNVDRLKEKAHLKTKRLTAEIPECLEEKQDQIDSLEKTVTNAIEKKKQYLATAENNRVQYENSMKQINDWLHGAEILTDSGYDTLDLETISCTLKEHQDYFNEASMCQDEMEQVVELSERLLPSLDNNDTETLRQTLKQYTQRLNAVMAKSARKEELLKMKINEWNSFQIAVAAVDEQLQMITKDLEKTENIMLVNQSSVKDQLKHIKFLTFFMTNPDGEVTEKSLSHILEQWEEFKSLEESLDKLLMEIKDSLPTVEGEDHSLSWLNNQLKNVKDLSFKLKSTHSKVEFLRECAQTLDNILPTAEARAECQKTFLNVLEKVKRFQNKIKETQGTLEEKIEDMENFIKEELEENHPLNQSKLEVLAMEAGKTLLDDANTIKKQMSQGLATETPSFQEKIDEISQKRRKPLGERSLLSNQDCTDSISSERISSQADYHYPGVCLSPPNLPMRNASIHHEEAYGHRNNVVAKEQQLQDAVQNQGQFLLAVQRVNTQLDKIQLSIKEEFNSSESCIEDFQKSLSDFYDLKSEIVKLREEGMKLVDPSQPDSFKTMQSTFTMLNDRVENLEVFAEIRSTQIKTPQKENEVHVAAFEEIKAQGKHIDHCNEEAGETIIKKPSDIEDFQISDIQQRKRKLEETMFAIRQLDISMGNLRKWLSHIEHELSTPLYFMNSEEMEFKSKLEHQKNLQRDIEHHSTGVGSVLNLCEVLLHDSDACPSEQIMKKIHGMYSKLEKMNKVYRKLAREGRTDHMGTLKSTIFYCNKEWDIIQHRVSALLINLRQSAALDDDFKTMKNVLYKWLTDIDVRVTDLEHFSSMSTEAKMAEVKKIEKEIDSKERNVSSLDSYALLRMEKEDVENASEIQREVDELKNYMRAVSERAYQFSKDLKKIEKEIDSKERNVSSLDSYALLLMEKEDIENASKIQREVDELKNYMRAVSERAYQFSKDLKLKSIMSPDLASDTPFDFEMYTDCSGQGSPQEEHIVGNNAGVENKLQQCEPINLVMDETAMWSKLRTLSSLKVELESNKERILGLKDTTDRLLTETESEDMMIAQDKMHLRITQLFDSYDKRDDPRPNVTVIHGTCGEVYFGFFCRFWHV
uniref:Nesprin-1 n=1 Tax=Magallana gigas TaxID=29159 RepID=K1QNN8_MAGGI